MGSPAKSWRHTAAVSYPNGRITPGPALSVWTNDPKPSHEKSKLVTQMRDSQLLDQDEYCLRYYFSYAITFPVLSAHTDDSPEQ